MLRKFFAEVRRVMPELVRRALWASAYAAVAAIYIRNLGGQRPSSMAQHNKEVGGG